MSTFCQRFESYLKVFAILFLGALWPQITSAQGVVAIEVELLTAPNKALSIRAIAALSDDVIWASSNLGTVLKTGDSGKTWQTLKVPDADSLQFRDIHLFNEKTALIMGSGWPTRIYKTDNGGLEWRMVYQNNDSAVFLDAFDFWSDGAGICFGDPINGKFFILHTQDFGEHWTVDSTEAPDAVLGEAGFAASGTSLICFADSAVLFASGGSISGWFMSLNRGKTWHSEPSGLIYGKATQGVFGIAQYNDRFLFVGGDYQNDTSKIKTASVLYFREDEITGGYSAGLPYQSRAVLLDNGLAISVGTPGCHVSYDGGLTWALFTKESFHTITKAKNGSAVFVAGADGRIAKLIINR